MYRNINSLGRVILLDIATAEIWSFYNVEGNGTKLKKSMKLLLPNVYSSFHGY